MNPIGKTIRLKGSPFDIIGVVDYIPSKLGISEEDIPIFIPKITKVLTDRRNGDEKSITRPTQCPTCESELLNEDTLIKCQNLDCPDRVVNSIIHFAKKASMNIDGLGNKIVELFVKNNIIKNILDLYHIKAKT